MGQCITCARTAEAGSLSFSTEVQTESGSWRHVSRLAEFALCENDYQKITRLADASVQGFDEETVVLGMPLVEGPLALGTNHCNCCEVQLSDSATAMELLPSKKTHARGSRTHRVGAIRRLRLCSACHGWWLSMLLDPSGMNGTASRVAEGSLGGWHSVSHGDAVYGHLGRRDELILRMTMEADGREARRLAPASKLHDLEFGFIRAGRADRATRFILSMPADVRNRFAVVAQEDQLIDAEKALKRGAREILSSPLSPQQIVGAAVRSFNSSSPGRDAKSGLQILGSPLKAYGENHFDIRVEPRHGAPVLEVVLLVRKFIRGWDEIGADRAGNVLLRLSCERGDVERVLARLRFAMGTTANFNRPNLTVIRNAG